MLDTQTKTESTQGVESVFEKVRLEVIESYPSIFSKDDVILLLDRVHKDLEELPKSGDNSQVIEKVIERVVDIVENYDYESDCELSISYNNVVEVDFNHDGLVREIRECDFDDIE